MKPTIIFLDIDDTLAQTSNYMQQRFNIAGYAINDKFNTLKNLHRVFMAWRHIKKNPTFWLDLPVSPHGHDLVNASHQGNTQVHILSALPIAIFPRKDKAFQAAAAAKKQWVKKHFPQINIEHIHVVHAREKHKHVLHGALQCILVDDSAKNIARWQKAKGVGLHILADGSNSHHIHHTLKTLSMEN